MAEAMTTPAAPFIVPTRHQYKAALSNIWNSISKEQKAMLGHHFSASNRTTTAKTRRLRTVLKRRS
jgi:hypothetical protein